MLIRLFSFLLESSPLLRRLLWRWWYGRLAKNCRGSDWTFMNYGFAPADPPPLPLDQDDEPNRFCIQLYQRLVSKTDLNGKEVLEVGSGRGGGASFIARYHRPVQVTGADFSAAASALCKTRHTGVTNLQFVVGDAENLPFADGSFDVVLNVESSHCYGHIGRFFAEVDRVLRPGGRFLYTDFRAAAEMPSLHACLAAQTGWTRLDHEDITAGVVNSIEADDARKRQQIAQLIPPRLHHLFGEFAGLVGGQVYESLRKRELLYHCFVLQKVRP